MVLGEIIAFICTIQTTYYNILEGVAIDNFTLLDIQVAIMLFSQCIWFLNEIIGKGDSQKQELRGS